ncbi:MAG: hypothetical protein ABW061_26135, partial [Polyangiaceae bacterium]
MSYFTRLASAALLLVGALGALGACQSLAGIEDRKYDGNAAPSAQCQQYCAFSKTVCTGDNAQYTTDTTCLATCKLLPAGEDIEPTGNTVACRISQLIAAQQDTETESLPGYCAAAGPSGNGRCGSDCDSYCSLYAAACKDDQPLLITTQYADHDLCVSHCEGLADFPDLSLAKSYEKGGDTLQCRLAHLSAATVDPKTHCVHAQLQVQSKADPKDSGPCVDNPTADADCASYCQLEMAECTDEFAQYQTLKQCQAVCGALTLGKVGDTTQNTVGCRKYHSYNTFLPNGPASHCPHTGPGGDGHCGSPDAASAETVTGNCESYCQLAAAACDDASNKGLAASDTFASNFKSKAECQQTCNGLDGA